MFEDRSCRQRSPLPGESHNFRDEFSRGVGARTFAKEPALALRHLVMTVTGVLAAALPKLAAAPIDAAEEVELSDDEVDGGE